MAINCKVYLWSVGMCYHCYSLKMRFWAGEIAQWLRALPALPKVLISIPSNHMVAHNHL